MYRYFKTIFLCSVLTIVIADVSASIVYCYWGTWAYTYKSPAKFLVSDIDTDLCTHIAYAFIGLDSDANLFLLDPWFDIDSKGISNFIALKDQNPDIKLLVSLGGWNQGSANYSEVASNSTKRLKLNKQIVHFLNKYGFDGLDLDWEYPNNPGADGGGRPEDYFNFVTWLEELRSAFYNEGKNWLLTAAVGPLQYSIDSSYNVTALNEILDFIILMTYDYHGVWEKVTGANAPLYAQRSDISDAITVKAGVEAWIFNGALPSKLILGIGAFGKVFTLAKSNEHGTGSKTSGSGSPGPFKRELFTWSYNEICSSIQKEPNKWTVINHNNSYVYAYKDKLWIGYDNPDTSFIKGKYAKQMNLGGVMLWSLDNDDFNGICGEKYSILKASIRGYFGKP